MKLIRKPLTPVDKMFQQPPVAYTPGSLAKKTPEPKPEPLVSSRDESEPEPTPPPKTNEPRRDDA